MKEKPVRLYVVYPNLESAYAEMAGDMSRENEALEWAEATLKGVEHETA